MTDPNPSDEVDRLRGVITQFLQDRLQSKLTKDLSVEETPPRSELQEDERAAWLEKAANDAQHLQQVTHPIKFSHPQIKGASSVLSEGNPFAPIDMIGTHSIRAELMRDLAITDAKYLPVHALLSLEVEGRTLLDRSVSNDAALKAALNEDEATAERWMRAFAGVTLPRGRPTSHKLAKQMYWPLPEGGYHLLAPLLSSSLAHAVYQRIKSDLDKAARKARRKDEPDPHGYRSYPKLAMQKFGGSNAQNVSPLNKKRNGENYLLASLPPLWKSAALRAPLGVETVFLQGRQFGGRREVRGLLDGFRKFLKSAQGRPNNWDLRNWRQRLLTELCEQVLLFAAELRELEPGWSARPECRLNLAEQCWLDPARTLNDAAFAADYRQHDWKHQVARRFANWLNQALTSDTIHPGGPEALEWHNTLERELDLLREDLSDD